MEFVACRQLGLPHTLCDSATFRECNVLYAAEQLLFAPSFVTARPFARSRPNGAVLNVVALLATRAL